MGPPLPHKLYTQRKYLIGFIHLDLDLDLALLSEKNKAENGAFDIRDFLKLSKLPWTQESKTRF